MGSRLQNRVLICCFGGGHYSILWIALFGLFGKLYIHENPEGDAGIQRMKNAVWVDLVNALLWLISAVAGAVMFFFGGEKRSLHTGRATV